MNLEVPSIGHEAFPGEKQYRGKWQFNTGTQPTPTDLALIASPILAAQPHPLDETAKHWSITTAYALWKEARRFCEALPKGWTLFCGCADDANGNRTWCQKHQPLKETP